MDEVDDRTNLLCKIEENRNSKAILYVTGDRQGLETQLGHDIIDLFVDHLDSLGPVEKISLILNTNGGNTSAAWNLVNLLHMFCDDFEVIAPGKCMSAGTLICLGANRIVMTKQATLGPIDPSIHHPLGPSIPGASEEARAPVSVEAVNGYLDAFTEENRRRALLDLSNKVHPLVLGEIFRSRQQIRDLSQRLLVRHTKDSNTTNKIIDFLCSESGSHDYTMNRREAADLGLEIEKCDMELYDILRNLRESFATQMELRTPFDINAYAENPGNRTTYVFTRAIIESVKQGAHHFVSEGVMGTTVVANQTHPNSPPVEQIAIQDQRKFEGWRKVQ